MFYRECLLKDIAKWERARKGIFYPAGTCSIQISATKGQTSFLAKPGIIPVKDVAIEIVDRAEVDPEYLYIILQKNMDYFLHRYKNGLNLVEDTIGLFPIQLYDLQTQKNIVRLIAQVDKEMGIVEKEIVALKNQKKLFLNKMFI